MSDTPEPIQPEQIRARQAERLKVLTEWERGNSVKRARWKFASAIDSDLTLALSLLEQERERANFFEEETHRWWEAFNRRTAADIEETLEHAEALAHQRGEDVAFLLSTVIWMSGSDDFASDGQAGEEWARRRERVHQIVARSIPDPENSEEAGSAGCRLPACGCDGTRSHP